MYKILMVCLGNICRSPLAEGILKDKLPNNFIIDSCGTGNYHIGQNPDIRSIDIAKKNKIDISNHFARQFSISDFDYFDIIYVMDKSNLNTILSLTDNETHKNKVKLILSEFPNSELKEVPDPYFGDSKDFESCFELLNNVCSFIANKY